MPPPRWRSPATSYDSHWTGSPPIPAPLIDFEDDSHANVETYFTAFHLVRPRSDPLSGDQAFDNEMDYFVGGRYIDRFEQREGEWKIVQRTGMTDWVRIEPS